MCADNGCLYSVLYAGPVVCLSYLARGAEPPDYPVDKDRYNPVCKALANERTQDPGEVVNGVCKQKHSLTYNSESNSGERRHYGVLTEKACSDKSGEEACECPCKHKAAKALTDLRPLKESRKKPKGCAELRLLCKREGDEYDEHEVRLGAENSDLRRQVGLQTGGCDYANKGDNIPHWLSVIL